YASSVRPGGGAEVIRTANPSLMHSCISRNLKGARCDRRWTGTDVETGHCRRFGRALFQRPQHLFVGTGRHAENAGEGLAELENQEQRASDRESAEAQGDQSGGVEAGEHAEPAKEDQRPGHDDHHQGRRHRTRQLQRNQQAINPAARARDFPFPPLVLWKEFLLPPGGAATATAGERDEADNRIHARARTLRTLIACQRARREASAHARIEGLGNGAKGRRARLPDFSDNRQYVVGSSVGFRLDPRNRLTACGVDIRIAKLDALRLCGRKRRLCAARDQRPLLFRECRIEVQNERIDVRPKFGDQEWTTPPTRCGGNWILCWELTHNPWVVLQTGEAPASFGRSRFRENVDDLVQVRRDAAGRARQQTYPQSPLSCIAYFSMEFMLSEALPIYSGGLGNVAG